MGMEEQKLRSDNETERKSHEKLSKANYSYHFSKRPDANIMRVICGFYIFAKSTCLLPFDVEEGSVHEVKG